MFKLIKCMNGRQSVGEPAILPATAGETYVFGEALMLKSGKLTKATTKPTHICGVSIESAAEGDMVRCIEIAPNMVFETTFSEVSETLPAVGSKVALAGDALSVTMNTASGVATIHNLLGATAAGDAVEVVFR